MTSARTFAVDDDNISNGVAEDREEFLRKEDLAFFTAMIPTVVYIFFLMMVGVLGNSVVFLVYYKRFPPSVTRTYILAMVVSDLLTNTLSLSGEALDIRYNTGYSTRWECKVGRSVKSFLAFTSVLLLVAVALDRYRCVCRNSVKRTTQVRWILIACVSVAILFNVSFGVMSGAQTFTFPGTNVTGTKCSVADAYAKAPSMLAFNVTAGLLLVTCVVLTLAAYYMIARHLWRHKKQLAVSREGGGGEGGQGMECSRLNLHETRTYTDEETVCTDLPDAQTGRAGHTGRLDIDQSGQATSNLDIDQSGHTSLGIDQSGQATSNLDIDQSGQASRLDIDQSGQATSLDIDQSGHISLDIDQSGQATSNLDIDQSGHTSLGIDQSGQTSRLDIDQSGHTSLGIDQSGQATSNLDIDQSGHTSLGIDQSGQASLDIDQSGQASRLDIDQSRQASRLDIDQSGQATSNLDIDQSGHTSLDIDQSGQAISLDIDQSGQATSNLDIDQSGQASRLDIDQSGQATSLDIDQSGQTTSLDIDQSGHASRLDIDQSGHTSLDIDQSGQATSLDIDQSGHASRLDIDQSGQTTSLDIDQSGHTSHLDIDQSGQATNNLDIDQSGHTSHLDIDQSGQATNNLDIDQSGQASGLDIDRSGQVGSIASNLEASNLEASHLGASHVDVSNLEAINLKSSNLESNHLEASHLEVSNLTAVATKTVTAPKTKKKFLGSVQKISTTTTKMMFVLTVIYVISFLPYLVFVTLRAWFSKEMFIDALGRNVYEIIVRLYLINSSVNGLVYSLCSAKFRLECLRLFSRRGDVI